MAILSESRDNWNHVTSPKRKSRDITKKENHVTSRDFDRMAKRQREITPEEEESLYGCNPFFLMCHRDSDIMHNNILPLLVAPHSLESIFKTIDTLSLVHQLLCVSSDMAVVLRCTFVRLLRPAFAFDLVETFVEVNVLKRYMRTFLQGSPGEFDTRSHLLGLVSVLRLALLEYQCMGYAENMGPLKFHDSRRAKTKKIILTKDVWYYDATTNSIIPLCDVPDVKGLVIVATDMRSLMINHCNYVSHMRPLKKTILAMDSGNRASHVIAMIFDDIIERKDVSIDDGPATKFEEIVIHGKHVFSPKNETFRSNCYYCSPEFVITPETRDTAIRLTHWNEVNRDTVHQILTRYPLNPW
jgi:hypothetical protein